MDVAFTKMSSKGQIVIPADMRKNIPEGEKLLLIQADSKLIMKKASEIDSSVAEDIAFAKKTEEAWMRIESGKPNQMEFDDFVSEMKKW